VSVSHESKCVLRLLCGFRTSRLPNGVRLRAVPPNDRIGERLAALRIDESWYYLNNTLISELIAIAFTNVMVKGWLFKTSAFYYPIIRLGSNQDTLEL
jgi:hypothetical protein